MVTNSTGSRTGISRSRAAILLVSIFWVAWAALAITEFAAITVPVFLISSAVGGVIGIAIGYWLGETRSGQSVLDRYRASSFGKRLLLALGGAVVLLAIVVVLSATFAVSSVLGVVVFVAAVLGHRLSRLLGESPSIG